MTSGLVAVAEAARARREIAHRRRSCSRTTSIAASAESVDINSRRAGTSRFTARWAASLGAGRLLGLTREELGQRRLARARAQPRSCARPAAASFPAGRAAPAPTPRATPSSRRCSRRRVSPGRRRCSRATAGSGEAIGRCARSGRFPKAGTTIAETHLKGLPVCYHGQSSVRAALELRERLDPARDFAPIEVDTYAGRGHDDGRATLRAGRRRRTRRPITACLLLRVRRAPRRQGHRRVVRSCPDCTIPSSGESDEQGQGARGRSACRPGYPEGAHRAGCRQDGVGARRIRSKCATRKDTRRAR